MRTIAQFVAAGVCFPAPFAPSEDEAGDTEEAVGPATPQDPMQVAVVQLTRLVSEMAKEKKQASRGLEQLLDKAEGGGGESGGLSGARSKAAALRALRGALCNTPELLSQSIETLMEEDLLSRRSEGAFSGTRATARGWLEHRSRLGYFPNTIRWGWAVAGILDALRDKKEAEARARAGLLLAALDQSAVDGGSWLLAQEVLLEPYPPFSAFGRRTGLDQLESPQSRLLDPRWMELFIHKVKEQDAYGEVRKKLGRVQKGAAPEEENVEKKKKRGGGAASSSSSVSPRSPPARPGAGCLTIIDFARPKETIF